MYFISLYLYNMTSYFISQCDVISYFFYLISLQIAVLFLLWGQIQIPKNVIKHNNFKGMVNPQYTELNIKTSKEWFTPNIQGISIILSQHLDKNNFLWSCFAWTTHTNVQFYMWEKQRIL